MIQSALTLAIILAYSIKVDSLKQPPSYIVIPNNNAMTSNDNPQPEIVQNPQIVIKTVTDPVQPSPPGPPGDLGALGFSGPLGTPLYSQLPDGVATPVPDPIQPNPSGLPGGIGALSVPGPPGAPSYSQLPNAVQNPVPDPVRPNPSGPTYSQPLIDGQSPIYGQTQIDGQNPTYSQPSINVERPIYSQPSLDGQTHVEGQRPLQYGLPVIDAQQPIHGPIDVPVPIKGKPLVQGSQPFDTQAPTYSQPFDTQTPTYSQPFDTQTPTYSQPFDTQAPMHSHLNPFYNVPPKLNPHKNPYGGHRPIVLFFAGLEGAGHHFLYSAWERLYNSKNIVTFPKVWQCGHEWTTAGVPAMSRILSGLEAGRPWVLAMRRYPQCTDLPHSEREWLDHPNLINLAEACTTAGVELRVMYIHRNLDKCLGSTCLSGKFEPCRDQADVMRSNSRFLEQQLAKLDPAMVRCFRYTDKANMENVIYETFGEGSVATALVRELFMENPTEEFIEKEPQWHTFVDSLADRQMAMESLCQNMRQFTLKNFAELTWSRNYA